jgi:hypothetical protein
LTPEEVHYLEGLESQHRDVDAVYVSLKETVLELQQGRTPELIDIYRTCVAKLTAAYRTHIASEDSTLMEMGRRILSPADLSAIHNEMRARR